MVSQTVKVAAHYVQGSVDDQILYGATTGLVDG